jgi:DNA-directed RNA polymerase specialized sigma24 family protein
MYRTLEEIRARMLEIRELGEQAARIALVYKSPALDGMPRNGGGNAMDGKLIAKEHIEARRDALIAEVREMEGQVRPEIAALPAQLYAFCTVYYLSAYSAAETCKIMDRDETTLYRYKREVRKLLGE